MTSRRTFLSLMAAAPLAALATPSLARAPETFAVKGLAIRGFDPVAYFEQDAAVKGDAAHAMEWKGASWQFASADNLAAFQSDPDRWAPQYGGYCAYAMANGDLVEIDPQQFTLRGDKLYLNYSRWVRLRWELRPEHYIARADTHWPGVLA